MEDMSNRIAILIGDRQKQVQSDILASIEHFCCRTPMREVRSNL
jgi:hypothetical protein